MHVVTTIDLGGAENHLYDLISEQIKRGLLVSVVYLKGDHFWKNKYEALGASIYFLDVSNWLIFFKFSKLKSAIKEFGPYIVHAHMPPAELITRLALIGDKNLPFIITKHNDEPFAPAINNFFLGEWVAKRASKIICISKAVMSYMHLKLKIDYKKLVLIYYAVDVDKFQNASPAKDLKIENGVFTVGTVARLTTQKSLHTLLEAFCIFRKEIPNSRLIIVGVGPLEGKLKAFSKKLEISDYIIWTGKRSDVPSVIKCFDVFVLPSIYEGFGLVLLESMAAGVPVVASKVSAIPEVLDEGKCGKLFPVGDSKLLASALKDLTDNSLRTEINDSSIKRVKNFFSHKNMDRETSEVYVSAMAD